MTAYSDLIGPNGGMKVEIVSTIGPPLNVKDYGATGLGVADDTTAINACFAAAIVLNKTAYIPAGTYKTTAELRWNNQFPRIVGDGMGLSILMPTTTAFHVLHVGTGSEFVPGGGFILNIGIIGPSLAPTKTNKAGIQLDAVHGCQLQNISVDGCDIGFDFINNCYDSYGINLVTYFGYCNVGLNLRSGFQSGSDLSFYECWFTGAVAGIHIAGGGGGFQFFGCSPSSGQTRSTLSNAPVVLCKDYVAGTIADGSTAGFHGCHFEGWSTSAVANSGYAFHSYGQSFVDVDGGTSFIATATGGAMANGFLFMENPGNSQWTWGARSCQGSMVAPSAHLIWSIGSYFDNNTQVELCPFYCASTMTIAGSPVNLRSALIYSHYPGTAYPFRDADAVIELRNQHVFKTTNDGVYHKSADWGSTYPTAATFA